MRSLLILILLALLLSACGQKGDLILPDDMPGNEESEAR
ncbi:MAG: lipoprotein [Gammaproteobacteria bacterium]|nr:lipoprotein [Gammaproteobacteria bacterium]